MTFYLNHMTHICITYHILTKYGSLLLCKILGNVCYYFFMLHIMSIVHWYLYFFSLFLVGWKTWLGVESGWARTEVPSLYFWKCEHSELLSTNQNHAVKSCLLVWFGLSYKNTLTQVLVGEGSTWEEDHSNLGAGFGQLEDFCTSWVKNFDVNPRSGCSLFVRRLKDVDENGGFCQNRFSHFRICNGANFCAQEISTNQLFIRTVCLFLFLSQYINLSLSVFLSFCIFASPGCFLAAGSGWRARPRWSQRQDEGVQLLRAGVHSWCKSRSNIFQDYKNIYFHGVKSTAHPPIIWLLGLSTDSIVKQPKTATIKIDLFSCSHVSMLP